jgi:hypothetical protein
VTIREETKKYLEEMDQEVLSELDEIGKYLPISTLHQADFDAGRDAKNLLLNLSE